MFNCVYVRPDGEAYVYSTENSAECVPDFDGDTLVDISESSTVVDVTTSPPVSGGLILAGITALLLLAGSGKKRKGPSYV